MTNSNLTVSDFSPADAEISVNSSSFSPTISTENPDTSATVSDFSPGVLSPFSPGFPPSFNPPFAPAISSDFVPAFSPIFEVATLPIEQTPSRPVVPDDYSNFDTVRPKASGQVETPIEVPSAGIYKWTFTVPSQKLTATGVMIVDSNNYANRWFIMSTSPDDKTRVPEIDNVLDKCKTRRLNFITGASGTKASYFDFIGFGSRLGHSYKYTANSIANLGELGGDISVFDWLIDKDRCINNKKWGKNNNRFSWNGPDDFVMGTPLSDPSGSGLAIYINGLGKHISDYYGGSAGWGQVYFRTRINKETEQRTLVMEQFISNIPDANITNCSLYWDGYEPVVNGGWYEVDPSTYTLTFDKITQDDLNKLIKDTAYIETYSPADADLPMGLQLQR